MTAAASAMSCTLPEFDRFVTRPPSPHHIGRLDKEDEELCETVDTSSCVIRVITDEGVYR
jgi:hypothetical protein